MRGRHSTTLLDVHQGFPSGCAHTIPGHSGFTLTELAVVATGSLVQFEIRASAANEPVETNHLEGGNAVAGNNRFVSGHRNIGFNDTVRMIN